MATTSFQQVSLGLGFIAVSLLSSTATASDITPACKTQGLRDTYIACLENADAATPAMQTCIDNELAYQNQRLNKAYAAIMATLNKTHRITLRDSERKWIAFRDSACRPDQEEGQGQQLDAQSCVLDETTRQATRLEGREFRESLSK